MNEQRKLITAGLDISPFIDSIEDYAVFVVDTAGIVRSWNTGAMRIKGYRREEIIGRSFEAFYPEEDLCAGKPALELVVASRLGRFEDEGWRVRKDGSRFWANVVITAARDEHGALQGFVKVTRDLTERRAREQRLREAQAAEACAKRLAVLRSITEVSLTALELPAILDEILRRIHAHVVVDAVALLLVDPASGELVLTAHRGLPREVDEGVRLPLGRGVAGRVAVSRAPLVVPDLAEIEVTSAAVHEQMRSAAGVPLIADGVLLGVLLVTTRAQRTFSEEDMTMLALVADLVAATVQRARAHAALIESERRFRSTFELAAVGVAHVGLDGRWLRANGALCEMLGYSAEELAAKTFQSITHPDDLGADLDLFERLIAGSIDRYAMRKRYIRRDGGVVWIQLTVSLVRDDDGRPAYAISVIEDVSAQRRAEEDRERLLGELREALSTRDRFLSIASHELRTPLAALMLQAKWLTKRHANDADADVPPLLAARLGAMSRQIDRLAMLVEQLLDVTQIHEGRLQLHPEQVDLGALVREVVERFEEQAAQSSTPIEVKVGDALMGWWDRSRLDQVLTNLVSNAVKYGAGNPISIIAGVEGDRVRLVVADRGIGIREEDRGRLFGRFERLVSDPAIGGMGLGLWITREIVGALGGTIDVASELGRGTELIVELPRRCPARAERASVSAA